MKEPVLRIMACSDLHYKDDPACIEKERFEKGLRELYAYADSQTYKNVDAIIINGDFTNRGTRTQMLLLKKSLKKEVRPETMVRLTLASHEYCGYGKKEGVFEKFKRIFEQPTNFHEVVKGFHIIGLSTSKACHFDEHEKAYASEELAKAHEDAPKKPIFFFQHPHVLGTVYGSIKWGEKDLNPILVNYPQIINFSGHSHAPINDPRSIHQEHFTSVGTGTFSYFELDEFDKIYGTFPPDRDIAAQMVIVEAYEDGSVDLKPYDVITGRFFPDSWHVEKPWDPDSFIYTDEIRQEEALKPYFTEDATLQAVQKDGELTIRFTHAKCDKDPVNDYVVTIYNGEGICRRFSVWAPYYRLEHPDEMEWTIPALPEGKYRITVKARGFFHNSSAGQLESEVELK